MTVRLEYDDRGVTTITIARPEVKNALDGRLIAGLTARVGEIDPKARCVVLRSEGDAFCAGADIAWMRAMADNTFEENVANARALAAMFARLDELPMPLLTRVQGAAIGGGAGLVAVSDIAVASTGAVFAFSEVRLGILPAVISPYVVRRCGSAFTTAAFTTGVRFDASRALQAGLVDAVAAPDHLDHTLGSFIEGILASGPRAVNAAKRLVRDIASHPASEVRELTVERIAAAPVTAEGQEGLRAFLERRKPNWPTD